MREACLIKIFRRNGELFVSPSVGSAVGFQSLPGVIRVDHRDELIPALEAARAQIEEAWARPKDQRFPDGTPFFLAAGASSWEDFVRGTVSVGVRYGTKDTKISVQVPDPNNKRLEATDSTPEKTYPPDLPLADAAAEMLKLLDEVPG